MAIDLDLRGCRAEPLGSYLKALGILRIVHEQADPTVQGFWAGGCFVLRTVLSFDGLKRFLLERYVPSPVISPWNESGGPDAPTITKLCANADPRLDAFRETVTAARAAIATAELTGSGKSKKEMKAHEISACRALFPDAALPWLDAAVLTDNGKSSFSPLLGSGGNDGRYEVAVVHAEHIAILLGHSRASKGEASIHDQLQAALDGREVARARRTAGSFDPGHAGSILSASLGNRDKEGFVNRWDAVLSIEGTLLFAGHASRRHDISGASFPFMTRSLSNEGYAGASENDESRGEIWAPLWREPAAAAEIESLLGEGRMTWQNSQSTSTANAQRAAKTLGVDRGLSQIGRHAIIQRNGLANLAVPIGRVRVADRADPLVSLTSRYDAWLRQLGDVGSDPVGRALQTVRRALSALSRNPSPGIALGFLAAIGHLDIAVGASPKHHEKTRGPSDGGRADDWLEALGDIEPETRLAAGLASLSWSDSTDGRRTLRHFLVPVRNDRHRLRWSDRVPAAGLGTLPMATVLAAAARRAMIERNSERSSGLPPFELGRPVSPSDALGFFDGSLDERRVRDEMLGFMTLDWRNAKAAPTTSALPPNADPHWRTLAPFFHGRALRTWLDLRLAPEPSWPDMLLTGQVNEVLGRVQVRARTSGLVPRVPGYSALRARDPERGQRLLATLLLRLPPAAIGDCLTATYLRPTQ